MNDRLPTVRAQLGRRTLITGAAWSAPAILLATAAPAAAVSLPTCTPAILVTDWTSSSWVRTSATTGTYTWINPLGNGSIPVLTLTVTASVVGPSFTSLAPANLTGTAGPTGGFSQPGLDLSLNLTRATSNTTDTGADYLFSFSQPVTGFSTTIADIDGAYFGGISSNSGAERVRLSSPSAITGTITKSAYLTGSGTSSDQWRRRPNSTPNLTDVANASNDANVALASAALSSFTLGFRLLDNTSTPPANYNLWLTPMAFTLLCP